MKKIIPQGAVLIPDNATCVFEGQIFDVYQWQQTLFDNSQATFEMLRRSDTVCVMGIIDNKIIVLEEEQPHSGVRISFPTGRVDKTDDSTLSAAQREMQEETGYHFNHWRLVQVMQRHTKIEWFIYVYVAWEGSKVTEPHLDAGEKIGVQLLDFELVKQKVFQGVGYLSEARGVFENLQSVSDLLSLPEFHGTIANR